MQSSFTDLEYAAKKKLTRRDRFLAEIDAVTPWTALAAELEPFYPKGKGRGRPPIGLERMLRMYVAQQCFGLSDEGIEDAIYDSQSIRRFVGIDLGREDAPDATTLLKFRRLLETHELTRKIFETINRQLAEKGLLMRDPLSRVAEERGSVVLAVWSGELDAGPQALAGLRRPRCVLMLANRASNTAHAAKNESLS